MHWVQTYALLSPDVCLLCLQVSGYVFCYPCAVHWVRENGCCPVTRLPATEDHIRRIRGSEL